METYFDILPPEINAIIINYIDTNLSILIFHNFVNDLSWKYALISLGINAKSDTYRYQYLYDFYLYAKNNWKFMLDMMFIDKDIKGQILLTVIKEEFPYFYQYVGTFISKYKNYNKIYIIYRNLIDLRDNTFKDKIKEKYCRMLFMELKVGHCNYDRDMYNYILHKFDYRSLRLIAWFLCLRKENDECKLPFRMYTFIDDNRIKFSNKEYNKIMDYIHSKGGRQYFI